MVIVLSIVGKQMILDGVRGKNGNSILGIADKHCWTKTGALGDYVSGIGEVGLDRVVNTCSRSVKYERNHASDCVL